jgi:hypothetical protein
VNERAVVGIGNAVAGAAFEETPVVLAPDDDTPRRDIDEDDAADEEAEDA